MPRSPWARLTSRMTPKTSDRPVASSAYSPPSSTPWTTAFSHSIVRSRSTRRVICGAGQLGGPARQRDPALEQAVDAVGGRERLVDVLLDEQDRGPAGADRRAAPRRAGGRRSGPARARPRRAAAAAGWPSAPARSRAPAARRPTARPRGARPSPPRIGKQLAHGRRSSSGPAARPYAPTSRFSSTVRLGKTRRPSGTSEMPWRTRSWARTGVSGCAVVADLPAGGRLEPGDRP